MYSFRQSRFGGGQDPWFRIGTWDVGSAGIAALAVVVGMVLVAVEGRANPASQWLVFNASDVAAGQVWRLLTWFVPSAISLWTLVAAFLIFSFGSQIEGALGRVKMAQFLAVIVAIPAVLGLAFYLLDQSGAPIALAGGSLLGQLLFFVFVLYLPGVRFFFGIPGWVMAAVVIALQLLSYLADRNWIGALHFLLTLGLIAVATKAFGLAEELPIPAIQRRSGGRAAAPAPSAATVRELDDARFRELDIDPILDQIAAFGVESLSADQRRTLESFSKRKGRKRGR
ncbi:MAG: hypothetical protein R2733_23770 [Acidimicrobiales bacterium]